MFNILAKNKNLRYLWLGQLISALGDRLTQMGILTFLMLNASDKGDKMARITFFSLLPFLLLGPLFGALADRYSRKSIMIFADIARAALVIGIPLIWLNTHSIVLMIIWFFILGTLTALFTPAKMSIITNITDKDILLQANSVIVTTGMVATLVGTLIAGVLIKIIGIKVSFYINSLTYIISAIFILNIFYQKTKSSLAQSNNIYSTFLLDIKGGISFIKRHDLITKLMILSSVFSFMSSFSYILILNYGSVVLKKGPLGMGVLLSSAGFGMIAGTLILSRKKDKVNYKRMLYLSYLIMGTFLSTFFVTPAFYLTVIILFLAGIGAAILTVILDTIFQRVTPDELKGKIFAARGIFTNGVFLLSLLLVGLLIKFIPAQKIFVGVGMVALFFSLSIFLDEKRWGYKLLRLLLKLIMRYWFKFRVSGLENIPKTKRVIMAGNHTSLLDGPALMCAYPERVYFLAADTLFNTKFLGWCFRRLGYIPIKRGGFNKESIQKAVSMLKSGYSICVFPEGKISRDGKLAEGREGVAVIAKLTGAKVVPFAIEGAHEAWPLANKFPRRFPVEVRFAAPIDVKEYPTSGVLLGEVMQSIAQTKLFLEREGYLRVNPDDIIRHLINIG